jgi:hypothetical protein
MARSFCASTAQSTQPAPFGALRCCSGRAPRWCCRSGQARSLTPFELLGDAIGRLSGLYDEIDEVGAEVASNVAREGVALAANLTLECGSVADTIVCGAEEEDAAAIVLGARGLSRTAAVLGSVSQRVARHATRPVLVLPPESGDQPGGTGSPSTTARTA